MLVVLRIVGLAVATILGVSVLSWIVTGERRWLRIAWVVFKYAAYGLALILALFAGEALLGG